MVTHDPMAASYADQVVFLVDGRVVGRMTHPTVEAVATQLAHLDELVWVLTALLLAGVTGVLRKQP